MSCKSFCNRILLLSKLIEVLVRVASRLLQVNRGNMMIAIDCPTDSICHRIVAAKKPSFSARERIQLLVANLMLSEGFAHAKLDEMWYNSCQGFRRASLPFPRCQPKGTHQQLLSSVSLLLRGRVAIGARLDHPYLDLERCIHST